MVEDGQLHVYAGNYSAYLEQLKSEEAKAEDVAPAKKHKHGQRQRQRAQKVARQLEARRAELEAEIQQLEARLSMLTRELELASRAQWVDRVYDLGQEYADVQEQLQRCLEEWAGATPA